MKSFYNHYFDTVIPTLKEKFSYKSVMEVPKIKKVVINMGLGSEVIVNSKALAEAQKQLALISGQKPIVTVARKSNASFKIRKDLAIGCKVTLRKKRMYEFLERFMMVALPRVRDFRGISKNSFDKDGNLSIGIKEQIVFPEINYDQVDKVRGLDITIVTTAKNKNEALELLKLFNIPFNQ